MSSEQMSSEQMLSEQMSSEQMSSEQMSSEQMSSEQMSSGANVIILFLSVIKKFLNKLECLSLASLSSLV
jgi:hypothetical protein